MGFSSNVYAVSLAWILPCARLHLISSLRNHGLQETRAERWHKEFVCRLVSVSARHHSSRHDQHRLLCHSSRYFLPHCCQFIDLVHDLHRLHSARNLSEGSLCLHRDGFVAAMASRSILVQCDFCYRSMCLLSSLALCLWVRVRLHGVCYMWWDACACNGFLCCAWEVPLRAAGFYGEKRVVMLGSCSLREGAQLFLALS